MERFAGGCLCGDVRVQTSGLPFRVGLCHCLDCRKHDGALFHASAIIPQDAVTIEGETQDDLGRHFCPRCGSSVSSRSADEIEKPHLSSHEHFDHAGAFAALQAVTHAPVAAGARAVEDGEVLRVGAARGHGAPHARAHARRHDVDLALLRRDALVRPGACKELAAGLRKLLDERVAKERLGAAR